MVINSRDFSHSLKYGSHIEVTLDNGFKIRLRYLGRDALAFWGNSLQSGSLMHFAHCKIEVLS